jgi:hypothetical protein
LIKVVDQLNANTILDPLYLQIPSKFSQFRSISGQGFNLGPHLFNQPLLLDLHLLRAEPLPSILRQADSTGRAVAAFSPGIANMGLQGILLIITQLQEIRGRGQEFLRLFAPSRSAAAGIELLSDGSSKSSGSGISGFGMKTTMF